MCVVELQNNNINCNHTTNCNIKNTSITVHIHVKQQQFIQKW